MKTSGTDNFEDLLWSASVALTAAINTVPQHSGVYLFGGLTRIAGVEVQLDPLYIGRAVNLRKRLAQHYSQRRDLGWRSQIPKGQIVVVRWSSVLLADIASVEVSLIRTLSPKFNVINYSGGLIKAD